MRHATRRGFTLIEILVVVAVIALLIGSLAVGLQAAGRSARKARELNLGRQIGAAWSQYSTSYQERLLPGWLEPEVQQMWKVKYRDSSGDTLAPEFCRSYPWRLLSYLGHDFEAMYGYLEREDDDWNAVPGIVANNPAFGINAYYMGGWWEPYDSGDPDQPPMARPVYADASYTTANGLQRRGGLVCRSIAQIGRSSELMVFTSSSYREPGFYKDQIDESSPGAAWVVPPKLATEQIWRPSYGNSFEELTVGTGMLASALAIGIQVEQAEAVPAPRINNSVATVRADLSSDDTGLIQLQKMSAWISVAAQVTTNTTQFFHNDD